MKMFVALALAIVSVSGLGSGPYLPSGWRPQGPAFYLPGEVQKPAPAPEKVTLFEAEASGSDALQEYGPPKVSDNFISQALPDEVTEQNFLIVEDKAVVQEAVAVEENIEQNSEVVLEVTTEAQIAEVTAVYEKIADIELQTDVTTVTYVDGAKVEEIAATVAAEEEKLEQVVEEKFEQVVEEKKAEEIVVEKLEQAVVQEVEAVQEGVKNIADALVNLESEIKSEQVQSQAVTEIKTNQESSGSTRVPEGFLEYGPPGFREYGPPKGDDLLRTATVLREPSNSVSSDSTEARRRRFSPKFKSQKSNWVH